MTDSVAAWRFFERGELLQRGRVLAELRMARHGGAGVSVAGPEGPTLATQAQLDALLAALRAVATATKWLNERFPRPCP